MQNLTPIFTNASDIRAKIYEKALTSMRNAFPIDLKGRTLHVDNVHIDTKEYSPNDHKNAVLTNGNLTVPMRGDLVLKDATGNELDRVKKTTLAHLPYFTDHHTLVMDGNEYQVSNMLRAKSGVYTTRSENGELSTWYNLAKGRNFSLVMNPEKGSLYLNYGTSNIPLYPVLRAMGVSHNDIARQLGSDIAAKNEQLYQHKLPKAVESLYAKLAFPGSVPAHTLERKIDYIKQHYANTQMNPDVNEQTLGLPHKSVTTGALLDGARKLLDTHRGDKEPDEVDSLAFKTFHAIDDFIGERIGLTGKEWKQKARLLMHGKDTIRAGIKALPFTKGIRDFVTTSTLTAVPTGINPIELIDHAVKVTSLGEGGISSERAIPQEARQVHATHFGTLDPIRTPESGHAGIDIRASIAAHRDDYGNLYTIVRNVRTNKNVPIKSGDILKHVVAFPHQEIKGTVDALVKGQIQKVPAQQVEYQLMHESMAFSPATSLLPLNRNQQNNRTIMGAKMQTQGVPLPDREAPLVQVKSHYPDGRSFEKVYGHMVVPVAPVNGIVEKIENGFIHIRPDAKTASTETVKIPFQTNFPFPSKTHLHHTLSVQPGQRVDAGQLLGESNFTRNGTLALGKNLQVAYVPYHGQNSNDAVVISEAAAEKLTSEHMYREVYPLNHGIETSKAKHKAYFNPKYGNALYEKLDESGVVRKGVRVNTKDILVAGLMKTEIRGVDAMLGKISKALATPYKDAALLWEHGTPGDVIEVVKTPTQITILVKTLEKMQIGDKLCYDEETDVLTETGWKSFVDVSVNERVATLQDNELIFDYPSQKHTYKAGDSMYGIESQQIDLFVTTTHNMYVKRRNRKTFELIPAKKIFGKRVQYKKDALWNGQTPPAVTFPTLQVTAGQFGHGTRMLPAFDMPVSVYLFLLGAFLAEGNCVDDKKSGNYGIDITQIKSESQKLLIQELDKKQIKYSVHSNGSKFRIYSKQLLEHFKQFGHSNDKYIPEFVFSWNKEDLKQLFHWLMWGDGHRNKLPINYTTTSKQLADNFQRLLLLIGYAGNIQYKHIPIQKIKGKYYHCKPVYTVRIINKKLTPEVNHGHVHNQKRQKEYFVNDYDRPVYGLTVPGGVVYVRRNGKPVWSGNSGRFGNKGVVSQIVPTEKMLRDESGKPLDVLMTSAGINSRINPSQIHEVILGKIAQKMGKPIVYDNGQTHDVNEYVENLRKEHGVKDKEILFDPISGRHLKGTDGEGVLVGPHYIMKLFKSTATNFSGHSVGPYDLNEQPLKVGGEESAKSIGKMEFDALVAHDARGILQEASTLKGQKSNEFWRAMQTGMPLPAATPSFAYRKFLGMLEGAGVKVEKRDSKLKLLPAMDADVLNRSSGEIEHGRTLISKNLQPEPGGLFDLIRTGGPKGTLYSHISLHESVPNPVFEEPIRRLLGLTKNEFDAQLQTHGGEGFKAQLATIDIPKKLAELRERSKKVSGTALNDVVKQIKYLTALQKENLHPKDAYIISKVAVIPPVFRPLVPQPNDPSQLMVSDANKLYAHLLDNNQVLKETVLDSDRGKHRHALYNSVGALFGTHEIDDAELKGQSVKGFISNIAGKGSPKGGFFHRKLLTKTQDLSGRGTAVPDVNLNIDQIGIPEQMLWSMYQELIVARLVRRGYGPLDAKQMVANKTATARAALLDEIKDRPVFFNRAPTLHRFSIVAAKAVPVQGKTIRVNPLIEKGLNLDYDGDQVNSLILLKINKTLTDELTNQYNNLDSLSKVENPTMTSRFKEIIGYVKDDEFYLVNLADFPHTEKLFQKEHRTFYNIPQGVEVIVYDEVTGKLKYARPSLWSKHTDREIETVELVSGKQLVTDDDPRAVYGLNDKLEFVRSRPKDAVGMWVPVGHHLDFVEKTSSKLMNNRHTVKGHFLKNELTLTEQNGRVIGTLAGDGWAIISHGEIKGVALASVTPEVAIQLEKDLKDWCEEPIPMSEPIHRIGGTFGENVQSTRYTFNSKNLGIFVHEMIGSKAQNKHLPTFFLTGPFEFRLGILAGLLDTDGSIAVSNGKKNPQTMINFTSVSLRLCQEITWLSKSLGVHATISPTTTPLGAPCWQVTFSTPEMHQLGRMPCSHPEKASRFKVFFEGPSPRIDVGGYTRQDPIPTPNTIAKILATLHNTHKNNSKYVTYRTALKKGFVSRFTAKESLRQFPELRTQSDSLLQQWILLVDNEKIRWDRVVGFTKTGIKEDGYDLTVPGYETFMNVEGVILSNTLQVHVPVTPAAVKDAHSMTLSNMLLSDQSRNKLMVFPQHEAIIGATLAAKSVAQGPVKIFNTHDEVLEAYRKGALTLNDHIEVKQQKTAEFAENLNDVWDRYFQTINEMDMIDDG